ncbi:MAG: hypothetical protein M1821_004550 [Bathelium mastoideum]|nr:MAG: hypothetical protein M1821_004550 [Bathelium mastoideum]
MALACVYADLVEFCQDIHVLFAGRRGSRFRTITVLKDLCWQPFDTRFNKFLRSFDQHAMSLSLELKVDHASNVLKEFELLQEKLSQMEQTVKALRPDISSVKQSRRQQEEEENTNNSVRRLLRWIRPPGWQQSFDDANRRFPGTCGWLLDEPCYKAWEGRSLESSDNRKLLLVQGKPGYGKTYLCASLIERLKYSLPTSKKTSSQAMEPRLLFYFYDKRQPRSCQSICGFRAVLAQLLQANKCDREILDLACFAMGESVYPEAEANLEELKATYDETLSLIQIILQRSEGVTLVFDGVDECLDTQNFFDCLAKATDCIPCPRDEPAYQYCSRVNQQSPKSANIKVALFCRPDLHVPRVFFERASHIQLASQHNVTDIEAFIQYSLQGLVDDALLGCHIDLRSVSASVSSRANGMFLWARLLIEYLRCDTFTPQDRMEALLSLNNFEGLDRLYGAILQKLHQRLPANGRLTVHKAFAWVAGAFRPLLIDEFKVAIAIVSGRNTSSGYMISNIEQALIRMSGALLELAADRTVRFIHPSVREYMCESSLNRHISPCVHFRLNNIQVQLQLADLCLVYILEQLPPGPLSGSSQLTPDRAQIITAYPFLQYSIAFWTRHCTTGLCSASDETGVLDISRFVGPLKRIEDLILSKERVATWIEASWLFGVRPQLEALVSSFGQLLLLEVEPLDAKRLEKITATLWLLSMDIQQLRKDWDLVLSETPNEIWNPSISSHAPSDLWPKAPGATWKSLRGAANQQDKAILVESHTFENSMELGLVKILVPRHILALPQQDSRCTSGWRASYEIWSLSTSQVRFRIFLEIDPAKVQGLISTGHIGHIEDEVPRLRELEFQFPVVFGDSSQHVLILDYLIYVEEMLESQSSPDPQKNCRFSIVDLTKGSPGVLS